MSQQEAKWYIVQIQSGSEKKVIQQLHEKARQRGLSEVFEEVFMPAQEVSEVRRGKKMNVEKKFFPGYILIKMQPNRDAWYLVRSIDGVFDFLGAKGNNGIPQPVAPKDVAQIRDMQEKISQGAYTAVHASTYEIGENVKVIDGPFEGFVGVVEEVDQVKSRLKVSVSIFGRATPIELEYGQVTKV
ncbi:transcription termination/antitermination protein NusG [Rickettsiales endosymbiont of Stachyamoeba lipophora]|uniref:transcription termination/antitermination protein NusG n=1 Tax=Rickettsiales endosymbiont of Stachyamoeba lipophora TaxID=2486578 RepID=UPI000F64F114|nr:transcription termination/antitermination protein NusG [Rickettsiales endosymbiont of Stachyamoeba lipophora]AZL15942.1 transcription termination/antitermination factor NusG [Rickettsiales endosymbiont of Stachyamoeba lipophora]